MKRLLSSLVWDKMKENYDIKEIQVLIKWIYLNKNLI